jgi:hypothetical protein
LTRLQLATAWPLDHAGQSHPSKHSLEYVSGRGKTNNATIMVLRHIDPEEDFATITLFVQIFLFFVDGQGGEYPHLNLIDGLVVESQTALQ